MKQLRFFILSIFVFFSITTNAVILSGYCGPNATFVLNDDGTLVISGTGEMDDFGYSRPNAPWKDNAEDIINVVIEGGITSIGNYAYFGCINLTSVYISNSVTKIDDYAFNGCTSLTSITIPNSVTKIGGGAFRGCTSLTSMTIPNSVTIIVGHAFSYCTSLTSITIPNSVTFIGSSAFQGCTSLTSMTIPNSVTEIGSNAFSGCTSLTSMTIPNSVTEIGFAAFYGCTSLASITIPNSVTFIGGYAFSYCTSLTSMTIPNSVTEIGENAFYACSKISSVTLGNSVRHIRDGAFGHCYNLKTFISRSYDVPETYGNAFDRVECKDGILYVPQKSLSKYASTSPWKEWGNIMGLPMVSVISLVSYAKISVGESIELKPTIYPESADDKSVTWKSSDSNIVSVDNGRVYAHKVGKATITATTVDGSNLSVTCNITVDPILASNINLNKNYVPVNVGDSFTLTYEIKPANATYKDVIWLSSDTDVATVENGYVRAKKVGYAIISVKTTDGTNLTATCHVAVNSVPVSSINLSTSILKLEVGEHATLSATIKPDNATNKKVEWYSLNSSIASVSKGTVTAIAPGSCVIKAKTTDGTELESSCVVTVANIYVSNLSLDKESIELLVDDKNTITASVYPANATNPLLLWTSSNGNVATVNAGLITAQGAGTAVITVRTTDGSEKMATCNVTVKKHQQTIEWNQDLSSIMNGGELIEIHAKASSGLPVVYSSSNDNVISIFDMGSIVYLNPINVGTSVITVTQAGNRCYEGVSLSKEAKVIDPSAVENIIADNGSKYIVTSINGIRLGVFSKEEYHNFIHNGNKGLFIVNGNKILIK